MTKDKTENELTLVEDQPAPTVEARWKDVFQVRDELVRTVTDAMASRQDMGKVLFILQEAAGEGTVPLQLIVETIGHLGKLGRALSTAQTRAQANEIVLENLVDAYREEGWQTLETEPKPAEEATPE